MGGTLSLNREEVAVSTSKNIWGPLLLKGTPMSAETVHVRHGIECGQLSAYYLRLKHHELLVVVFTDDGLCA